MRFKYTLLLLILIATGSQPLFSQVNTATSDSLANELVARHRKINAVKNSMPGYRIQIYFGTERTKAMELKADFLKNFSETGAYLIYQQPNFKVRVGDFRTRLEAVGFLKKMDGLFTTAFIVPDEIKLPAL